MPRHSVKRTSQYVKNFQNQKKNTDNPSAIVVTAALDARDENWTVSADGKGIEDLEFIYDLYSRFLTCPF